MRATNQECIVSRIDPGTFGPLGHRIAYAVTTQFNNNDVLQIATCCKEAGSLFIL